MLATATATAQERGSAAGNLPLILFAIAAVALTGITVFEPAEPYDEGLIVSGAARILRGEHPYSDFNSGYPPGQFYTVATLFRIVGPSLIAERVWDSLWRLAIVAAALWLAREAAGDKVHLLPLACVAAVAGAAGFRLYPMVAAMLPCLCGLALVLRGRRTGSLRWTAAGGVLLGAAAVYRHDLAACFAAVALGALWRDRRAMLCVACGAAAVVLPVAAFLFATVPPADLRRAFLDFPALNAAARHLPLPAEPFPLMRNLLLPAVIIAAACRTRGRLILAAAAGLTLLLALQRLDSVHAFPAVVLCLVLLAARPQKALIAVALVLYGAVPVYESVAKFRFAASIPASGIDRAGPVRIAPDQAAAVRYVRGQSVYVGTTTHSRIWYNDALFAFLAGAPQPTRYDMWVPGQTNTAPVQREIVAALERNAVRYAVLFDAPASDEPNASSIDTGVTILDDYLKSRYRPARTFGRYRVLERAR
jgi:4-amino-4-deoxy-L-arabinose transferase-like glycosyltransferase